MYIYNMYCIYIHTYIETYMCVLDDNAPCHYNGFIMINTTFKRLSIF